MKSRWFRIPLVFLGCLVLGLGLLIGYGRAFSGQVRQYAANPSGTLNAEVIADNGLAAATDAGTLGVTLKTWFNPFRHYVFVGSDYGAQITISWISDRVLLIRCEHCEKLKTGKVPERKWHQVTVCYGGLGIPDLVQNNDHLCPPEPK